MDYIAAYNEIFQRNNEFAIGCEVIFNGDTSYEVQDGMTHTVCLDKKTCTCRSWELSGILCQHRICALVHNKQDPKDHISIWYHEDMYRVCIQE